MRFLIYVAVMLACLGVSRAGACVREVPCALDGRSYHVRLPDGWDGVTPLPVMLHFHGWGRTGALPVQHRRISGATRLRGVLLVAPNGLGKTWDFWRAGSRDVAFAEAVLRDVAARYPIDEATLFVSGYSYGAAMAWRFACDSAVSVRALLAVSGTLRDQTCAHAPQEVRHTHGLDDGVLPFPYGPGGDVQGPVALWRDVLGCDASPVQRQWNAVSWLTFTRFDWGCAQGRVVLDVHPASHLIPRGWFAQQLDELLGL